MENQDKKKKRNTTTPRQKLRNHQHQHQPTGSLITDIRLPLPTRNGRLEPRKASGRAFCDIRHNLWTNRRLPGSWKGGPEQSQKKKGEGQGERANYREESSTDSALRLSKFPWFISDACSLACLYGEGTRQGIIRSMLV